MTSVPHKVLGRSGHRLARHRSIEKGTHSRDCFGVCDDTGAAVRENVLCSAEKQGVVVVGHGWVPVKDASDAIVVPEGAVSALYSPSARFTRGMTSLAISSMERFASVPSTQS